MSISSLSNDNDQDKLQKEATLPHRLIGDERRYK